MLLGLSCEPVVGKTWAADRGFSIDEGALRAIARKESGGRLLPAGVLRVDGLFASHQAVRLVVRRKRKRPLRSQSTIPEPRASYNADSPIPFTLSHSRDYLVRTNSQSPPAQLLSTTASNSASDTASLPDTPDLRPVMSLSSSIASLDPLSRSIPPSPALPAIAERLSATSLYASPLGQELRTSPEAQSGRGIEEFDDTLWEEEEIGKGLAQYNSVEIDRVKGVKRLD